MESSGSGRGGGQVAEARIVQGLHKSFAQVQGILDQNRLLINEIHQNQASKIPDNLTRNVGLLRELNNNIRRAAGLYADLSLSFSRSMQAPHRKQSNRKHKRGITPPRT